jgi:chromate transporter
MPLGRVAYTFLRIGAVAFGGLGATLVLLERELVERFQLITKDEITEALTYTKLLPGSTVVQVVAYLAWRVGRWSASAVATICFLLPSMLLMLVLAYGYSQAADLEQLQPMRRGLLAAVTALLLLTMYRLARPVLKTPLITTIAIMSFLTVALVNVNAMWIVIGSGLLGVLSARPRHH